MVLDGSNANAYKMTSGERLGELASIEEAMEEYFGEIERQTETVVNGQPCTMVVVEETDVTGLDMIAAGRVEYSRKKDQLGVVFDETPIEEVDDLEAVDETFDAKNGFLEDVTGRTPEQRKESIKREAKKKKSSSERPSLRDLLSR